MTTTNETASGLRFITGVLGRWIGLIILGVVFAVAIAGATLLGQGDRFVAHSEVLIAQPNINATELPRDTARKISELMPTYVHIATSDAALRTAISDAKLTDSLNDLRKDIKITQETASLVLNFDVTRDNAEESARIATSINDRFATSLENLGGGGKLEPPRAITLQAPRVTKHAASVPTTLISAAVIGFITAIVIAFALDRS